MNTKHGKVDTVKGTSIPAGRFNATLVDQTTETDLARQQRQDDISALQDMAKFTREVRRRLGLSQKEFAGRIHVSIDTIRNWEQGRRYPTGASKALLKILYKAPEICLDALT